MASYDDTATVSGSVVSFSDGADEVGLKSCVVTVSPTLSGISLVSETQTGTNAWNEEWEMGIWNSLGEKSASNNAIRSKDYIPVFSGAEYYIYGDFSVYSTGIVIRLLDGNKAFVRTVVVNSSSSKKITMDSSVKYIVWCSATADGITSYANNVSVNYPSTDTSYHAYTAPTTHTASLGRTIYGGTADIVNGNCEPINWYSIDIGADRFSNNGGATHANDNGKLVITATTNNNCGVYINTTDTLCVLRNVLKEFNDNNIPRVISFDVECSVDNATLAVTSGTRYTFKMGTTKTRVSLISTGANCSMYVQGADLGQACTFQISDFQLEKGTTATAYSPYFAPFTFTPVTIETSKGSNTFWSDQGDSEVTYYKDGYGFTSVTIHKETPDGEPVEQTAKLHQIVYGGLVDVISGKAEPKNLLPDKTYQRNANTLRLGTDTLDGTLTVPKGTYTISVKTAKNGTFHYTASGSTVGITTITDGDYRKGTFTLAEDTVLFIHIYNSGGISSTDVEEIQLEIGSNRSEYAPHFEPFTFPPISMETDEGENTLYADQGDSAIVYRKAVE